MFKDFLIKFQKKRWNNLAKRDANYFIYSKINSKEESGYRESGLSDYNNLLGSDEALKKQINFENSIILEIGCGNGRMTEFIAQYFKKVIALDISEKMISIAKKRITNFKNIDFIVGDGVVYNVLSSSVDFVFSYAVFHHFISKKIILTNLKEVKRVLRPGGIAKIQFRTIPAYGGVMRYFKWYYGVYLLEDDLNCLIKEAGLNIISRNKKGKELWVLVRK